MKILIVGAGAVGQVYGRHLAMAGAEVSFFVREKYATELRQGLTFYPLNRRRARSEGVRMPIGPEQVLTTLAQVSAARFDQVYLCVSSPALRAGAFDALLSACGDATIVSLQPAQDDRSYLLLRVPEARLVSGMITAVSYLAPLPGETVPTPGMAYWFPPAPSAYSGARAPEVARLLAKGGLPATTHANVSRRVAFSSALLMTLLTALESAGWSFSALRRGDELALMRDAAREAFQVVGASVGAKTPLPLRLISPRLVSALLAILPALMPYPVETYLRVHFTKVNAQTRFFMQRYIDNGRARRLPTAALEALEASVAHDTAPATAAA